MNFPEETISSKNVKNSNKVDLASKLTPFYNRAMFSTVFCRA
jgi:hypothetical protein